MSEAEILELLVDLFYWDNTLESKFSALCILRAARGQPPPSWDDFKVGKLDR